MSKSVKLAARSTSSSVEVKSRFDAEFRRFGISRSSLPTFDEFIYLIEEVHKLKGTSFTVAYTDPEGDLLPITNNENFARALTTARPLLRVFVQQKGQSMYDVITGASRGSEYGGTKLRHKAGRSNVVQRLAISQPEDFRRVSSIIDVDILPPSQRRVRLMKNGSDRPLGFYIRDGTSIRVTAAGLEKVPGVFISRLVPGGLAESTGLLAVNDEVLEVNGIDVTGKTLDQVTDMMVANSANLIVTVKPVNQRNNVAMRGIAGSSRSSVKSTTSYQSAKSQFSLRDDSDEVTQTAGTEDGDEDVVKTHFSMTNIGKPPSAVGMSAGANNVLATV